MHDNSNNNQNNFSEFNSEFENEKKEDSQQMHIKTERQENGKEYAWSYILSLPPNSIDVSSDGSLILVSERKTQDKQNTKLYLIKNDGTLVWEQTFPESEGTIQKVVLSDDGNYACAMTSNKIYLFSRNEPTPLRNITASPTSTITSMDMSGDGRFVAVGFLGAEPKIAIYNTEDFSNYLWYYNPSEPNEYFLDLELSCNGDYLVGITNLGYDLYLFNRNFGASPIIWKTSLGNPPKNVEIDANASVIAVASNNVTIFSSSSSQPIYNYGSEGTSQGVSAIVVSSDGSRVAAAPYDATYDNYILLVNTSNKNSPTEIYVAQHPSKIRALSLDSKGKGLLVGLEFIANGEPTIQFFENDSPEASWSSSQNLDCVCAALSDDGYVSYVGLGNETSTCKIACFNSIDTKIATISKPSVYPDTGDVDTLFNFSVTLTDPTGATPINVQINIDGNWYEMTPGEGSILFGKNYYFITTLSEGTHNYSFIFTTATTKIFLPAIGFYQIQNVLPVIMSVVDLGCTPRLGTSNTPFTFTALYTHSKGFAPTKHNITIDGYSYEMTHVSGDFYSGATYTYTTTFTSSRGEHEYFFEFSDGKRTIKKPEIGTFAGPSIYPRMQYPPSIINVLHPKSAYPGQEVNVIAIVNDSDDTPVAHVYLQFNNKTNLEMFPIEYIKDGYSCKFVMEDTFNFTIWAEDTAGQISWSNDSIGYGTKGEANTINVSTTPNQQPILTKIKVKRLGDTFEHLFSVTYLDPDGDEPYYCDLILNGKTTIKMDYSEGDSPSSGLVYIASFPLGQGVHRIYIKTTDGINNVTSEMKKVEVKEPPSVPLIQLLVGLSVTVACACLVGYWFWIKANSYTVDQILLLYNDGRLLWHKARGETVVDQDILGSMLSAVQEFMRDSFSVKGGQLDELKYGSLRLVMERDSKTILVVALSAGKASSRLKKRMRDALQQISKEYGGYLQAWDGLTAKFDGVGKYLTPMFEEKAK